MRFPSAFLPAVLLIFGIRVIAQSVPPGAPAPPRSQDGFPSILAPQRANEPSPKAKVGVPTNNLKNQAQQILKLSQSIQQDVEDFSRGILHQDLIDKLKQLEKQSKHLRGDLSR